MMNLTSEADLSSLIRFARLTESDAIALECQAIVQRLIKDGIERVDNPSVIVQMAVESLEPDREKRLQALAAHGLISSLASFGRSANGH